MQPHYVRCIKSNDQKAALSFDSARVQHQVKYLGLLENVKVKRAGYAFRHYFRNFVEHFGQLMDQVPPSDANGVAQFVDFITKKVPQISREEFGIGKSKVFIKDSETLFIMEEMLEKKLNPEAYKQKVEAFKESERKAKRLHGVKGKCIIS